MFVSRSSGSKGGKWEAAIFYKNYNLDSAAEVKKMSLDEFEAALTEGEKQKEIISITVYSTKLRMVPFNKEGTRHHFIMLELEGGGYWVFEKTQTGILVQRSKSDLPLLDEDALGSKRVQFRKVDDCEGNFKPGRGKSIGTVISWLRDTRQVQHCYNLDNANCIHFADSLFIRICERRSKELIKALGSFIDHEVGAIGVASIIVAVIGLGAYIADILRPHRN